jgi:hypothetical protein
MSNEQVRKRKLAIGIILCTVLGSMEAWAEGSTSNDVIKLLCEGTRHSSDSSDQPFSDVITVDFKDKNLNWRSTPDEYSNSYSQDCSVKDSRFTPKSGSILINRLTGEYGRYAYYCDGSNYKERGSCRPAPSAKF